MRKWVVFAIFIQTTLSAQFWLTGEALLMRPTTYRPYTVMKAPAFPIPIFFSVSPPQEGRWLGNTKPGYSLGYQINCGYSYGPFDFRGSWKSWIHTDPFSTSVGEDEYLWVTNALPPLATPLTDFLSPGNLRRQDHYRVQGIDGEVGFSTAFECWPFLARSYIGCRYLRVLYKVSLDMNGVSATSPDLDYYVNRSTSDCQGIGPRGGSRISCPIILNFEWFLDASVSFLFSSSKGNYLGSNFLGNRDPEAFGGSITPANFVMINPELQFGIGRSLRFGRARFDMGVSYKISYVSGAIAWTTLYEQSGTSQIVRGPFTLDGWDFHLGVGY